MSKANPYELPETSIRDREDRLAGQDKIGGGKRREVRKRRPEQIGLKVSEEKRAQFDRLHQLTSWSYTVIFEKALDVLEREWKAGRVK